MRSYALDTALVARLESWLAKQNPAPSRTAVLETALNDFLDKREKRGMLAERRRGKA